MSDPIRLWLWRADGATAGELVIQPGARRPSWITLQYPAIGHGRMVDSGQTVVFKRDPSDANMYREVE